MKHIIIVHFVFAIIIVLLSVICLNGCSELAPLDNTSPALTSPSPETAAETEPELSSPQPSFDSASSFETLETVFPSGSATNDKQIIINEINDKEGTFYLGQSYQDASSILYDREIEILQGSDTMLYTDQFEFSFFESKVNEIKVRAGSQLQTTLGLNFGDSFNTMIKLYGTNYTSRTQTSIETQYEYYEYIIDDHAFCVEFYSGKVSAWLLYKV